MSGNALGTGSSTLRVATLGDLECIDALVAAAFQRHVTNMGFPPVQLLRDTSEQIEAGEIWVYGDPITGVMSISEVGDSLLIENMAVHPSVQRSGIGRRLIEHAEQMATNWRLRRVVLVRNAPMVKHRDFYAHVGYLEADRRTEHGSRQVFMEKILPVV